MTHATLYTVRALLGLTSFLKITAPKIGARLTEVLGQELKLGETMPDLGFLVELLLRRTVRLHNELLSADRKLRSTLGLLARTRRLRDKSVNFLRGQLIAVRGILNTSFTLDSTFGTNFRGRVSQDGRMAVKQAEFVADRIGRPDFRPVPLAGVLPYPIREMANPLIAANEDAEQKLDDVLDHENWVRSARIRLQEAQQETAQFYLQMLNALVALGHIAEAPSLVKRMPPSLRRIASNGRHKKVKSPESVEKPMATMAKTQEVRKSSEPVVAEAQESRKSSHSPMSRRQQRQKRRRLSAANALPTRKDRLALPDELPFDAERAAFVPGHPPGDPRKDGLRRLQEASIPGPRHVLASVRGDRRTKGRRLSPADGVPTPLRAFLGLKSGQNADSDPATGFKATIRRLSRELDGLGAQASRLPLRPEELNPSLVCFWCPLMYR